LGETEHHAGARGQSRSPSIGPVLGQWATTGAAAADDDDGAGRARRGAPPAAVAADGTGGPQKPEAAEPSAGSTSQRKRE
jgi:hypothetical protein